MKKLFTLLTTFAMLFAVSCDEHGGDDVNPNEKVPENIFFGLDKESVSILPDGGSVDVIVYSNYKWEISGTNDWCTPSVKNGETNEDGQKVTFTADVAYDNREATFWFRCADEKIKFTVSQSLKEVIIADENNTFTIPSEGGVAVLGYETSVDCEVIIPEDAKSWISVATTDATRGLVAESVQLDVAENNTGTERSAVVKVVAKDNNSLFAEYTIAQAHWFVIKYTSTDGNIVTPKLSNAFGANILSNTYENGVGIIEFDGSITSIGENAFLYCSSIESVIIPNSVTSIGDYAFCGCLSLESIAIPDSVTSIGMGAFTGCSSLESITIPDSVTSIGDYAFCDCSSLTEFKGKFASSDCRCLIVDGVLNSFARAGLTKYTIPNSVISIGECAFAYCSSLASITIPNSVTSIGQSAFNGCSSLASVTIPDSVTSIGALAFYDCSSLKSVYCKPTTPPTDGNSMFDYNASGRKIYVPSASVSAYKAAKYWSVYKSYIVGYDF